MTIYLTYNPFYQRSQISIDWHDDGKRVPLDKNSRLTEMECASLMRNLEAHDDWNGLLPMMIKTLGKSAFTLRFAGTNQDFQDLNSTYDAYRLKIPAHNLQIEIIQVLSEMKEPDMRGLSAKERLRCLSDWQKRWSDICENGDDALSRMWKNCDELIRKDITVTLIDLDEKLSELEESSLCNVLAMSSEGKWRKTNTFPTSAGGLTVLLIPDDYTEKRCLQMEVSKFLRSMKNLQEPELLILCRILDPFDIPGRILKIRNCFLKQGFTNVRLFPVCRDANDELINGNSDLPVFIRQSKNDWAVQDTVGRGWAAVYHGIRMYIERLAMPRAVSSAKKLIISEMKSVPEKARWDDLWNTELWVSFHRHMIERNPEIPIDEAIRCLENVPIIPPVSQMRVTEALQRFIREFAAQLIKPDVTEIIINGVAGGWMEEQSALVYLKRFCEKSLDTAMRFLSEFAASARESILAETRPCRDGWRELLTDRWQLYSTCRFPDEPPAEYHDLFERYSENPFDEELEEKIYLVNLYEQISLEEFLETQFCCGSVSEPIVSYERCTMAVSVPSYFPGQKARSFVKTYIEAAKYENAYTEALLRGMEKKVTEALNDLSEYLELWKYRFYVHLERLRSAAPIEKRRRYFDDLQAFAEKLTDVE